MYRSGDMGRLVDYRAWRRRVGGEGEEEGGGGPRVVLELLGRRDTQVKVGHVTGRACGCRRVYRACGRVC